MTEQAFYDTINQSKYGVEYLSLVQTPTASNKFEVHHIHPRSLGGSSDSSNLVKLSSFEHILAHYYLALIFQGEMLYAFKFLAATKRIQQLSDLEQVSLQNLVEWGNLREKAAHKSPSEKTREKIRAYQTGRKKGPMSEETKEKLRKAHTGKKLSPEHVERIRQSRIGKPHPKSLDYLTEEFREKLSKSHKEWYSNEENKAIWYKANVKKSQSSKYREKMSKITKEVWKQRKAKKAVS